MGLHIKPDPNFVPHYFVITLKGGTYERGSLLYPVWEFKRIKKAISMHCKVKFIKFDMDNPVMIVPIRKEDE